MVAQGPAEQVAAFRHFNRFYTRQIGVLHEKLLTSPFSLTEVRVLYELFSREGLSAGVLARELGLDPGYVSRIVRGFEAAGCVSRSPSPADARASLLALTPEGRAAFAPLDQKSHDEAEAMLQRLSAEGRERLVIAMEAIEGLLGGRPEPPVPYLIRPHQPGDMGWIIHRHGVLYPREYGWDEHFEALVAEIAAKFIRCLDPKRERCWIAEREGGIVGSIFLVRDTDDVAKLRLLYVEPDARGLGIGTRLVDECIRFARLVRYRRIVLWTSRDLAAARRIYERAGFRHTGSQEEQSFGRVWTSETWVLDLDVPAGGPEAL
jgi:DNA-binding MarR family transcriptional regulator/GNAT superfamily N-acetyltransferase